jgi:hypothetical protein
LVESGGFARERFYQRREMDLLHCQDGRRLVLIE